MTREQVYYLLPKPIQEKLFKNTADYLLDIEVPSVSECILTAFHWEDTEEGNYYWNGIYKILKNAEDKLGTYV